MLGQAQCLTGTAMRQSKKRRMKKEPIITAAVFVVVVAAIVAICQQQAATSRFHRSFEAFNPTVETPSIVREVLPEGFFSHSDNAAAYIIEINSTVHRPGQSLDGLRDAVLKHSDEIVGLVHQAALCDHCDFLAAGLPPPRPLGWNSGAPFIASRMSWIARILLKQATQLAERDGDRAYKIMLYLLALGEHLGGHGFWCDRSMGCGIQREACKALAGLTQNSDPSESKMWANIAKKTQRLSDLYHWKGHQILGRWHASISRTAKCDIDALFIGAMARCAQDSNDISLRLLAIDGLTAVYKLRWWSFPGMEAKGVLEEIANNKNLGALADYARESLSLPRAKVRKHYSVYSSHASVFEKELSNWR